MSPETFVENVKEFARLFRYGTKEKLFSFIGVSLIGLAAVVPKLIDPLPTELQTLSHWIVYGLYILGGLCLAWVAYRFVFKLALPKPHDDRELPNAIKGLLAFTQEDGELFRKLGRDQDIKGLTALVQDPQIPLVVIMGESGAGKSSLLRAGLANSIKSAEGVYIYWEALPHKTVEGLLRAVNSELNTDYADLTGLLKMPQKAVIVLDQFEQLQPENPDHQPIFELLGKVYSALPPHPVTWCITFRREYAAVWRDFELDRGLRPPMLSLKLFSAEQARNIFITLAEAASLSLEQDLVDGFVESVKRVANGEQQPRVSPVDIGIGLQMLNELVQSKQSPQLGLQDFNFAGGSQGLFVSFVNNALTQRFPETAEREALYKVLLECIDLPRNQRIAEGKTEVELAATSPNLPTTHLHYALEYFASPQLRILEKLQGDPPRYRLPHETMIPALRQLGGKLLGEVAEAELLLQTAYASWQNSGNNRKYLLSGRELKKVIGCKQQLDLHERGKFVKKSQIKRQAQLGMVFAVLALTPFVGYYGYQSYLEDKYRNTLNNWGLPGDLIDYAGQLQSLTLIAGSRIQNLDWLADFKELDTLTMKFIDSDISSLSILQKLKQLKTLSLELAVSKITNFNDLGELQKITTLAIDGYLNSDIADINFLLKLKQLTTLSLNLEYSNIADLSALRELKQLTALSLNLKDSKITNLIHLRELQNLNILTLNLAYLENIDLSPLHALKQLNTLTLNLKGSRNIGLGVLRELNQLTKLTIMGAKITDPSTLHELKKLNTLDIDLGYSEIVDLSALQGLDSLTTLTLTFERSNVNDLSALQGLTKLTTLTLNMGFSDTTNLSALQGLTKLTTLTVNMGFSDITDLSALQGLTELTTLTLNLGGPNIPDLSTLKKLTKLTTLTVIGSFKISDLDPLRELKQINTLTLELWGAKTDNLNVLRELNQLNMLTLNLKYSGIHNLDPLQGLEKLNTLTMNMGNSQINDLSALQKLQKLNTLTLHLRNSKVVDLNALGKLKELTILVLDFSDEIDLSALQELHQLTTLKLDVSNTSIITSLNTLKSIKTKQLELNIKGSKINSLKGLPILTGLEM